MRTKWFSAVHYFYQKSPDKSGKVILTFVVHAKSQ